MSPRSPLLRRIVIGPSLRWGLGFAVALICVGALRVAPITGLSAGVLMTLGAFFLWYAVFGALGHALYSWVTARSQHFLVQVAAITLAFWAALLTFGAALIWVARDVPVHHAPRLAALLLGLGLVFGLTMAATNRFFAWLLK